MTSHSIRYRRQADVAASEVLNVGAEYDEDYPAVFNILLWFAIAFVFTLIAISCKSMTPVALSHYPKHNKKKNIYFFILKRTQYFSYLIEYSKGGSNIFLKRKNIGVQVLVCLFVNDAITRRQLLQFS